MALALNDFIARDRNDGLDPTRRLEASRVMDREEMLRLFPGLSSSAITGGAAWYDAQMYNADRVLLAFVQSAVAAGGVAANYVGARRFLWKDGRINGAAAQDELTGSPFDVRARVTINAAGGWAPELTASILDRRLLAGLQMSKALNIVTRLPAPVCALGDAVEGQFLFCVPWRGIAMFGTLHGAHTGSADDVQVREHEVVDFLRLLNRAFPAAGVQLESITLIHRGLLPALPSTGGSRVKLLKHSYVRDHRSDGAAGLITVVGVRYTTARRTAQLAVTRAAEMVGRTVRPSHTATTPLPGGAIDDVAGFLHAASHASRSVTAPTLERLARSYGTVYPSVLALMESDRSLARPLGSGCAVTRGEVVYSVREEMAVRLADALLRRTEAGSAGFPGADAVESAAAVMAVDLGWDPQRTAVEIDLVRRHYQTANLPGASSQAT
jgi:glycerol-3-phosphate dehydrogenase